MEKTSSAGSAVERAERILSRRPPVTPAPKSTAPGQAPGEPDRGTIQRADTLLGSLGQAMSGRGLLRAVAYSYVALAAKTQELIAPIAQAWQQNVDEARQEQEEQVARTQGASAGRQEEAEEEQGEQTLKKTAGGAAEAAGTAGEAAGA